MSGQVWLQIAGLFIVAIPTLMILTHLIDHLAKGFTASAEDSSKIRRYADFSQVRSDLMAGASIEEILDRCDGRIPEEASCNAADQARVVAAKDDKNWRANSRQRLEEIRRKWLTLPVPPHIFRKD